MADLNKRVQVLFSEKQWKELTHMAAEQKQSVGHLIREAVAVQYFVTPLEVRKQKRLAAVAALAEMSLPVDDWDVVKQELEERYADRT